VSERRLPKSTLSRPAAALVLAALALSCSATQPSANKDREWLIEAYRRGVAEAMREIRAGEPTIYAFGLLTPSGIEPRTGLTYKAVAGDAVDPDTLWRIRGHNDAIRAYNGVPPTASAP
jgi:hypothetical protein